MRAKTKHRLNIVIDTIAFIEFVFISTTGLLVKYTLPAGSGHYATIWGMDRHEWGDLHFWLCVAFLATLMLHLILHWKWISFRLRGKKSDASGIRFGLGVFGFVMLIFLGLIPMFSPVEYEDRPGRERRLQQAIQETQPVQQGQAVTKGSDEDIQTEGEEAVVEMPVSERTEPEIPHEVSAAEVDIRGYMTIVEVSEKFGVPAVHIVKELGLPENIKINQTLGRLRKIYDFEIHDVRDIVLEYKKQN